MTLEIGQRIATLRKTMGVTQLELANYLGVLPQTVSRWETDNGIPDVILLPKIATFFSITLDDLFGVNNMKKIEDLVCKYSVLRNESSYDEAIAAIKLQESNLSINNDNIDTKAKLLGEKMHLYLQKTRQSLSDTIDICKELINLTDNTDNKYHMIGLLQLQQLECMAGNTLEMVENSRVNYYSSKTEQNLLLYLNALLDSKKYEEMFEFFDEEFSKSEYLEINEKSYDYWSIFIETAAITNNMNFLNKYLPSYEKVCSKNDLLYLKLILEKHAKLNDSNYIVNKEELFGLLDACKMNEHFKLHFSKEIESL